MNESLFHVAGFNCRNGAAQCENFLQLGAGFGLQTLDFIFDFLRAFKNIGVVQKVGFIGHDLLHAERPLLVPGAGQAKRFIPGRQLHGAGPGIFRENHGEHFKQDAVDVVFRLLLGEAEGIHLHTIAEAALLLIGNGIALAADFVPEFGEGPHLAHFGDEADAGIHKERHAPNHFRKGSDVNFHFCRVEHGDGGGQCVGQFLHGRGSCLLQMIGADIHGIPFRQAACRK